MLNYIGKVGFVYIMALLLSSCAPVENENSESNDFDLDHDADITAEHFYSGFDMAKDTYYALTEASNGKVYYSLATQDIDVGGQMYVFDPETEEIEHMGSLTEISGEEDMNAVPQGKLHANFYERGDKLYFATHIGYAEMIDGMERYPRNLPEGYEPYPGGHIMTYDPSTGEFEKLATAEGEGIISMTMDEDRGHVYGITWPSGDFIHYDVDEDNFSNLGPVSAAGEDGTIGEDFRVLCRSLFVDHRDGSVYYSTAEGYIYSYNPNRGTIEKVEGVDLRRDYFGEYDYTTPGNMAYNWRVIDWYPEEGEAYGVHGNSGYLFRFDPEEPKLELVQRITSEPSQRTGMFDMFYYGYLGFELGPDGETLYYLTGGPAYIDGERIEREWEDGDIGARGLENLHLVTYNIPNDEYTDHGRIRFEDGSIPTYVQSITVSGNGYVYALGNYERNGNTIHDLMRFPDPLQQ